MSTVDTKSLLLQMQSLVNQSQGMQGANSAAHATESVEKAGENPFGELLAQSINAVSEQQNASAEMKKAFERGEDIELSEVMLQAQKASLSFQAMTQVRNKLVDAYKDVINMPL